MVELDRPRRLRLTFEELAAIEEEFGVHGLDSVAVLGVFQDASTHSFSRLLRILCAHEDPELTVEQVQEAFLGLEMKQLNRLRQSAMACFSLSITPDKDDATEPDAGEAEAGGSPGTPSEPSAASTSGSANGSSGASRRASSARSTAAGKP